MKKTIYTLVLFSILMITQFYAQQWEPIGPDDGRLTYSDKYCWATCYYYYPILAIAPNNVPYIAYIDDSDRNAMKTSVKKFNGNSWINVGANGTVSSYTSAEFPYLAFDSSNTPFIAHSLEQNYHETRIDKFDGNSWVNIGSLQGTDPIIIFDSLNTLYTGFNRAYNFIDDSIVIKRLKGDTWEEIGKFSGEEQHIPFALTTDSSDNLYIVFEDQKNNNRPTVKKFDGNAWNDVGLPWDELPDEFINFSIAIDPLGTPFVSYSFDIGFLFFPPKQIKTIVKKFDGKSWVDVGNTSIFEELGRYISLAIDNYGIPYIAYADTKDGHKIRVKRLKGNSWVDVGPSDLKDDEVTYTQLAIDSDNNLILLYQSGHWSYAKKFNTTALAIDSYADSKFKIYPNPVSDVLTVESTYPITKVEIYSILGQKLEEVEYDFNSVSTDKLISGIYLAKIYSDKGSTVRKLIKE